MSVPFFLCIFLLSGCSAFQVPPPDQTQAVNTTLVGTLTKTGTTFALHIPGGATTGIDSYTQKFDAYVGQKISVTGQYSGTTLFVDTLRVIH